MPDDIPNTVPNFEPDTLVAGDTATWRRNLARFSPADGWVISYALVQQKTGLQILITGTSDGSDHLVSIPPSVTEGWVAGPYTGAGYVTNGDDRRTIWRGTIAILPDLAAAEPGDPRTHARRVLDNIEAVLENRASQEVLEFNIEGTLLRKASVADLLLLRDRYTVIVRKEEDATKIASGKRTGRRILTRFTSANQGRFDPLGQVGDIR